MKKDDVLFAAGPTVTLTVVTPELAEQWLGRNRANRNVRRNVVDAYARDMANGNWELTGEPVKFAKDGRLLDGQHRLHAQVQSGVTLTWTVVTGLDPKVQTVMDSGARRTAADALSFEGHNWSTFLASGARVALAADRDSLEHLHAAHITHAEIRTFIEQTADFVDAVEIYHPFARAIASPKGVLMYVAWRLTRVNADKAFQFIESVATQEMLRTNDPRMVLAKRLNTIRESRLRETPDAFIALFFRAWNHWRNGQSITTLKTVRPVTIPKLSAK